jgi:nickel superoxide dismutase
MFSAILLVVCAAPHAAAHCEIPCGIYDDRARLQAMAEHISTIEKSMKHIVALSGENPINYNQMVRWVNNKEHHANELQNIVTQYFMTQRIKPDVRDYEKKLVVLHKMLVHAMKCKQTTDLSQVEALRALLKTFHGIYLQHEVQTENRDAAL